MIGHTLRSEPSLYAQMDWCFISAPLGWLGRPIAVKSWDAKDRQRHNLYIDSALYTSLTQMERENAIIAATVAPSERAAIRSLTDIDVRRFFTFFERVKRNPLMREAAFVIVALLPEDDPRTPQVRAMFAECVEPVA